jgi:indole-3-glycerol phosphate synthase
MPRPTILDDLISHKREEVREKRARRPIGALERVARTQPPPLNLAAALAGPGVSLIAEVKRQSLSKRAYCVDIGSDRLAGLYAANGAAAISVLADERYFGGGPDVVEMVVSGAAGALPVIYKDFILDPYQVAEARALGADAVLIIARTADGSSLHESVAYARALGMDCVVEIFTPEGADYAVAAGARIIGINNRDLSTMFIDLERSAWIRSSLPPDILTVSESGLNDPRDVCRAGALGFDAVLIGEAILTAADIASKVRELSSSGAGCVPTRNR